MLAAVLAFVGVRRTTAVQRENARKDQWRDRLKWAVDLALSDDPRSRIVGLSALTAITYAHGFDVDEQDSLEAISSVFLLADESGALEADATDPDVDAKEDADDSPDDA